jgi:hypothetical protein
MFYIIDYTDETKLMKWVRENFTPEEYQQFQVAQNRNTALWQTYVDQGYFVEQTIYESKYVPEFDDTFELLVGHKIILADGISPSLLQMDAEYKELFIRVPQALQTTSVLVDP